MYETELSIQYKFVIRLLWTKVRHHRRRQLHPLKICWTIISREV